ncbi:hypothetical protein Q7P37_009894 [Cladosporium fusiforme]
MSQSRDTDVPGPHGSEHDFILGPINHAPVYDTNWRMLPPLAYQQPVAPRQLLDQTPHPQQACSSPGLGPGIRQRQGCDLPDLEADTPYYAHGVRRSSLRATIRQGKQQTGTVSAPKPLDLNPHRHDEALRKGLHRSDQASASVAGAAKAPQMLAGALRRAEHQVVPHGHGSIHQAEAPRCHMQKDGFPGRSGAEYMQHAHRLQITDGRKSPREYPRFGGNALPACVPWATGEERHLRNVICFVQSSVWYRVQENMPCYGFPRRAISEYMRQYNSGLCSNGDAAFGCSLVGEAQDMQRPAFF